MSREPSLSGSEDQEFEAAKPREVIQGEIPANSLQGDFYRT